MRFVVLGAGLQGSACAFDLLRSEGVDRVVLADLNLSRLPRFLEPYRDDERLETVHLDANDDDAVRRVLQGAVACMNALPYYFNHDMARLAIEAGAHYADLGGNTEIVRQQLELDGQARERGISVIPDTGLAPGMVNILAAAGIAEMDSVASVKIRVGGLPKEPRPPLNYQIVYSLEGVLDYYTTRSWVLRDGRPTEVDALSEVENVEFPEPVGTLEAFHTAGGLSTMAWDYEGRIPTMEYKTLRYPGHAQIMKSIRDLGLLGLDPVRVGDVEVAPRDLFIAVVDPELRKPDSPDLVALRVEVVGELDGRPRRVRYDLLDYYNPKTGVSAMERTTAYSLSITGQMQADARIDRTGVFTPDRGVPADEYIRELGRRGIQIQRADS
ncbi:MAG TPA: saccharopine dehydrogenase C-terminal domain-containing protein [Longimicrobiales bacterium]|nr:saccharopine dehydrogenase C-terminal domain-containing protein [Longimicrobiales bacterium]